MLNFVENITLQKNSIKNLKIEYKYMDRLNGY